MQSILPLCHRCLRASPGVLPDFHLRRGRQACFPEDTSSVRSFALRGSRGGLAPSGALAGCQDALPHGFIGDVDQPSGRTGTCRGGIRLRGERARPRPSAGGDQGLEQGGVVARLSGATGRRGRRGGSRAPRPRPCRRRPWRSRSGPGPGGRWPGGGSAATSTGSAPRALASRVPGAGPYGRWPNSPGAGEWPVWPTTSGRCWWRLPPRATFSTWSPRQIPRNGSLGVEGGAEHRELRRHREISRI